MALGHCLLVRHYCLGRVQCTKFKHLEDANRILGQGNNSEGRQSVDFVGVRPRSNVWMQSSELPYCNCMP
jgi:hypothetical protein